MFTVLFDFNFLFPVHPRTEKIIKKLKIKKLRFIKIAKPLEFINFLTIMKNSKIIFTDSGGIQEEAPSLGKPVLVTRDTTERPEAVESGTVILVGSDKNKIVSTVNKLLNDDIFYSEMSNKINPYGDGYASKRILEFINESL